jgi:ABC-type dipeptide/oligopeptide/nickel transport system permease subunit
MESGKMNTDTATSDLPQPQPVTGVPPKGRSPWLQAMRRVLRGRLAIPSLIIITLAVVCAMGAPLLTPYDPSATDSTLLRAEPSLGHPFGTDQFGRDVLSRTIEASRTSVTVGLACALLAVLVGAPLGLASGYFGRLADHTIMRFMDTIFTFPSLILALALVTVLGPGPRNVIIAIGVTYTPVIARLVRGQTLVVRQLDYVLAARNLGARPLHIVVRHVWPNVQAPVIVQASLIVAFAMLIEASLSFLGVGVEPGTPTWGSMLRESYPLMRFAPWMAIAPGLAIFAVALSFNLLGDALRDALDPRLKRAGEES